MSLVENQSVFDNSSSDHTEELSKNSIISQESEAVIKNRIADFLYMNPQDPLLTRVDPSTIGEDDLECVQFTGLSQLQEKYLSYYSGYNETRPILGSLEQIAIIHKKAQGKSYSADQPIVRFVQNNQGNFILIGSLDGQTSANTPNPIFKDKIDELLLTDEGYDRFIPNLLKSQVGVLDKELSASPENLHYFYPTKVAQSIPKIMWWKTNRIVRDYLESNRPLNYSEYPGVTGAYTVIDCQQHYIESLAIADSPLLIVSQNGEVLGVSINTNSPFDKETVVKIRELIAQGKAADCNSAKVLLKQSGYYIDSFNKKINSYRGVPVCNGHFGFESRLGNALALGVHDSAIAAVINLSDGMFFGLNDFERGIDRDQLMIVIKMLLQREQRDKVLDYLENLENRSWNPKDPRRERLSDDKHAIVSMFINDYQIPELLNNLHFSI